jgi:hypothetical protein
MMLWLALSDVAPALAFACIYMHEKSHEKCSSTGLRELMFAAAIACRLCSLTYHAAAHAQWRSEQLFYVDLIGICTNALGVPYSVLCTGEEGTPQYSQAGKAFLVAWVLAAYMACVVAFSFGAMGFARIDCWVQQAMIIALAVAGSLPCAAVSGSLLGPLLFAAGYALFYVGKFPERFVPSVQPGAALHSHVLWHWTSAAGQLSFLVA